MNDGPSRIGVVGCGLMGAGIAEICARAGLDVLVAVSGPSSVDRARRRVADSLSRLADKGKIDREEEQKKAAAVAQRQALAPRPGQRPAVSKKKRSAQPKSAGSAGASAATNNAESSSTNTDEQQAVNGAASRAGEVRSPSKKKSGRKRR